MTKMAKLFGDILLKWPSIQLEWSRVNSKYVNRKRMSHLIFDGNGIILEILSVEMYVALSLTFSMGQDQI